MEHIGVKLSIPNGVTTMGATGGIHLGQVDQSKEEMESPCKLGIGTINIAPFWKD